jgi:hypothetical protein
MIQATLINNETGEIIMNDYNILELEDIAKNKEGAKKRELSEAFKQLQADILGNFVFFLFNDIDKLNKELNDNDLVKFIYLGTYVKNDGTLRLDNNKTYITKNMLSTILDINKANTNKFYNSLIEKKLLAEGDEGHLYINPSYFFRGADKDYKKLTGNKLTEFTRLYIKSTRLLYSSIDKRKYRQLAIAYKLLPFCSWKYNILCENPSELNKTLVEPINLSKVLELLHYDKKHMKKLINDLMGIKIDNCNLFKRLGQDAYIQNDYIVVNPLGYYRGNDVDELNGLINLFEIN